MYTKLLAGMGVGLGGTTRLSFSTVLYTVGMHHYCNQKNFKILFKVVYNL